MRRRVRWLAVLLAAVAVVAGILVLAVRPNAPLPPPALSTVFPTRLVFIPTPVTPAPLPTPRANRPSVNRPGTTWVDLDAIAPPGEERDMLIMECSNCHPFVCAVRGQRTVPHWEMVRLMHESRLWINLSERDSSLLFSYLESNFNDQKPMPDLPEALADQGCTTPALR